MSEYPAVYNPDADEPITGAARESTDPVVIAMVADGDQFADVIRAFPDRPERTTALRHVELAIQYAHLASLYPGSQGPGIEEPGGEEPGQEEGEQPG